MENSKTITIRTLQNIYNTLTAATCNWLDQIYFTNGAAGRKKTCSFCDRPFPTLMDGSGNSIGKSRIFVGHKGAWGPPQCFSTVLQDNGSQTLRTARFASSPLACHGGAWKLKCIIKYKHTLLAFLTNI